MGGSYRTIVNRIIGPFRFVVSIETPYWSIGLTVGSGMYVKLDVGPFGIAVMATNREGT